MDFSNQTDIFDPSTFTWPVNLIGVGGIGSSLLLPLMKLGIRDLTIWDPDEVEEHNIPSQLIYAPSDEGRPKVEAARDFLDRFGFTVSAHQKAVNAATPLEGVVISGVDSMASRAAIWEAVSYNGAVPLYLDGRVGGEVVQCYAVDPIDQDGADHYESTLFSDEDANPDPCAARAVIHPVVTLAGLMISQLTRFARGLPILAEIHFDVSNMELMLLDVPEGGHHE